MTVTDAHDVGVDAFPTPPACPPWCQSDHPHEDQVARGVMWHRAHYGFPASPHNPTPEFGVRIAQFDVCFVEADSSWMLGAPHLQLTHKGQRLDVNSVQDAEVAMELVGLALPHLLPALEAGAALAWPERSQ